MLASIGLMQFLHRTQGFLTLAAERTAPEDVKQIDDYIDNIPSMTASLAKNKEELIRMQNITGYVQAKEGKKFKAKSAESLMQTGTHFDQY